MNIQPIIHSILPHIEINIYEDNQNYLIISSFTDENQKIEKIEQLDTLYVDKIIKRDQLYDFLKDIDNPFFTIAIVSDDIDVDDFDKSIGFFSVSNELDDRLIFFYSPIKKIQEYTNTNDKGNIEICVWSTLDHNNEIIKYKKRIVYYKNLDVITTQFTETIEYGGESYDLNEIIEIN